MDGGERAAQLVAQHRQEFILAAVGFLERAVQPRILHDHGLDAPLFGDLRHRAVAQSCHLFQPPRFAERVIVRLEDHLSQRPQELGIDLQGGLLDGMPLAVRLRDPIK